MYVGRSLGTWLETPGLDSVGILDLMPSLVCPQAILAGDFILSAASMALARIGNNTVVSVLSQVIEDLVRGNYALFTLWSCALHPCSSNCPAGFKCFLAPTHLIEMNRLLSSSAEA